MASVNIDEMISIVGEFGRFQWMLEVVLCIMIFPQTYQVLIMYFAALTPTWRCIANTSCPFNGTLASDNTARCNLARNEWEYTEPIGYSIVTQFGVDCNKEWLRHLTTSIFFIGWIFGAVVLSWMADNYGRKKVLFPSTCLLLVVGFIASFMPNIGLFVFCRFIAGFLMPGCSLQSFILISESVGSKYRPKAGNILWLCFTLALCVTGLTAYYIREWKILFILCSAPYVFVILFYKIVPESVKWLTLHNKSDEAMNIFQRVAKWNKKEIPHDVHLSEGTSNVAHNSSPLDLFRTRRTALSTLVQGGAWLVNGMVYYGLSLAADDLGGNLYRNYILVSMVEFPAVIMAIDFCERFGRKKTVIPTMIIASVACLTVAFIPAEEEAKIARVIIGMIGKMFVTVSFDSIYIWSVEIFPTSSRGVGMGFLQITSRIGAASAPWVAKGLKALHKTVPFLFMGTITFASACSLLILPETKNAEREVPKDLDNKVSSKDNETLEMKDIN